MATKTIKFYGMGFGATPAQITATANGNAVFSGPVTTLDEPVWTSNFSEKIESQAELFSFEIDTSFSGNIPMTCGVTTGTVIFGQMFANYQPVPNPAYDSAQKAILRDPTATRAELTAVYSAVANPEFSPAEIAVLMDPETPQSTIDQLLIDHNCPVTVSSGPNQYVDLGDNGPLPDDPRLNVFIDGVAQIPDRTSDSLGTWWWTIAAGSTLSYDLQVPPSAV